MDGDKTIVRNKVRVSLYNGPFAIWTILSDRLIKNTLKLSECSCLSDHWTPKSNTGYVFYWWIHFTCIRKFCKCKLLPEGEVGTTKSGKSTNHPRETEQFASLFYSFYSSLFLTKSLAGNEWRTEARCYNWLCWAGVWTPGTVATWTNQNQFSVLCCAWPRLRNAKINYLRAGQMLHTMQCTCSAAALWSNIAKYRSYHSSLRSKAHDDM